MGLRQYFHQIINNPNESDDIDSRNEPATPWRLEELVRAKPNNPPYILDYFVWELDCGGEMTAQRIRGWLAVFVEVQRDLIRSGEPSYDFEAYTTLLCLPSLMQTYWAGTLSERTTARLGLLLHDLPGMSLNVLQDEMLIPTAAIQQHRYHQDVMTRRFAAMPWEIKERFLRDITQLATEKKSKTAANPHSKRARFFRWLGLDKQEIGHARDIVS